MKNALVPTIESRVESVEGTVAKVTDQLKTARTFIGAITVAVLLLVGGNFYLIPAMIRDALKGTVIKEMEQTTIASANSARSAANSAYASSKQAGAMASQIAKLHDSLGPMQYKVVLAGSETLRFHDKRAMTRTIAYPTKTSADAVQFVLATSKTVPEQELHYSAFVVNKDNGHFEIQVHDIDGNSNNVEVLVDWIVVERVGSSISPEAVTSTRNR